MGYVLGSLLSRKMTGERYIVGTGLLTMGLSFGLLGFIDSLNNASELFISAMMIRLIQGLCAGTIQTVCQADWDSVFTFEIMRALGLLIGPVIGILLNATFSLQFYFYILAVITTTTAILFLCLTQ